MTISQISEMLFLIFSFSDLLYITFLFLYRNDFPLTKITGIYLYSDLTI